MQKNEGFCIPRKSMERLIREVTQNLSKTTDHLSGDDIRFKVDTIDLLHRVSENYIIHRMYMTAICADHANRETCLPKDWALGKLLQNSSDLAEVPLYISKTARERYYAQLKREAKKAAELHPQKTKKKKKKNVVLATKADAEVELLAHARSSPEPMSSDEDWVGTD
jgi:histone H3/H4